MGCSEGKLDQSPQATRLIRLFTAAVLALLPCAIAQQPAGSATVAEQYLLSAANQERAARNLPLLRRDPQLAVAAARHAREMADHGSISHQFPGEPDLAHRAAAQGVPFSRVAENVAEAPNAPQIHEMWMNSEGHRANLLDPAVDVAGISVVARNGELYAVEDFARIVRSATLDQQESAIGALLVAHAGHVALIVTPSAVAAARQTCAMSTGFAGAHKPWFVMRFTSHDLTQLPSELQTQLASGRYHQVAVGACAASSIGPFTTYNIAVMLYP